MEQGIGLCSVHTEITVIPEHTFDIVAVVGNNDLKIVRGPPCLIVVVGSPGWESRLESEVVLMYVFNLPELLC